MTSKGPTPAPSLHPSRPSFDDMQEMLGYLLYEAPQDHRTAKSKVSFSFDATDSIVHHMSRHSFAMVIVVFLLENMT